MTSLWDGKCILPGFDDVAYFDERTNAWFNDSHGFVPYDYEFTDDYRLAEFNGKNYTEEDIECTIQRNPYIWHYGCYNYGRKTQQGYQNAIWQNRTYGRTSDMDLEELEKQFKETVTMPIEDAISGLNYLISIGWTKLNLSHPANMSEWLEDMKHDI